MHTCNLNAIPHGFDPFTTEYAKNYHKTVKKIREIPTGHITLPNTTYVFIVIFAEQLHTHHSKNENNNQQNKGQIGQGR